MESGSGAAISRGSAIEIGGCRENSDGQSVGPFLRSCGCRYGKSCSCQGGGPLAIFLQPSLGPDHILDGAAEMFGSHSKFAETT